MIDVCITHVKIMRASDQEYKSALVKTLLMMQAGEHYDG
jgi:hypothetical protein